MGSISHESWRQEGETRFIYRVVVPYTFAGNPNAPDYAKANREPSSGVITTDYYRSRQQANGAATRKMRRYDRHHSSSGLALYTFGKRQMQRAELKWAVEQAPVWEPVA